MPITGPLAKAIAKQVRRAAREAKVLRPQEKELLEQEAKRKASNAEPDALAAEPEPTPEQLYAPKPEQPVAAAPEATVTPDPLASVAAPAPVAKVPPIQVVPETEIPDMLAARPEHFALDEGQHLNFDKITSAEDVKGVIAFMAERNKTSVNAARREVIPDEEMNRLADDLRTDKNTINTILTREAGGLFSPELLLATRELVNASATRLKELAEKIHGGQATDIDRISFLRQQQLHAAVYDQFMGSRAEWGRSGRVLNKQLDYSPQQLALMRDLVDNVHGAKNLDRLAAAITLAPDAGAVTSLAKNFSRATIGNIITEVFVNSLLSWVKTPLINIFGNALISGMRIAETGVAARIGRGLEGVSQAFIASEVPAAMRLGRFLQDDERVLVGEASAMLHGELSAVRDAWRLAGISFRKGTSLDNIIKYDTGPRRVIASHNLPAKWQDTQLGRFVDGLGAVIRLPTERVMVPSDEFFKTLAYRAETERMAYRHVYQQVSAGAIDVEDVQRVAREFMENLDTNAQDAAHQYALETTFQNRLGPVGESWAQTIRATPAAALVAPFIRTPINLFKEGILRRSPLAAFTREFRNDVRKGGKARDQALARVTMASMTAAWVAAETANGNLTGGGPTDYSARQLLEATGWRAYSYKIQNPATGKYEYISYARAEPLAFVIGSIADFTELYSYLNSDVETLEPEEEEMTKAAVSITAAIINNTMSKTFTKGLADFAETLNDPGRYGEGFIGNIAVGLLPYSSFRRGMTQMQDPYMREAWTIMDKIRVNSGIPGYSQDAPARRDIFAEPRMHARADLLGPMGPFPVSKIPEDPVVHELAALMQRTHRIPIGMPGKFIEGVRLNAWEYDRMLRYGRGEPLPNGRTFHEAVQEVMENDAYRALPPDGQVDYLKWLQRKADDYGRKMLMEEPEFAEKLEQHRAKVSRLKRGE